MTESKASPSSARRRAFQATKRRAGKNRAQQEQTRHVGDAGPREAMGTRHHAPDMFTRVMQFVWDMFETALNLGDDADRYRLFDTVHALAAVYLPPDWLGSKPIAS